MEISSKKCSQELNAHFLINSQYEKFPSKNVGVPMCISLIKVNEPTNVIEWGSSILDSTHIYKEGYTMLISDLFVRMSTSLSSV